MQALVGVLELDGSRKKRAQGTGDPLQHVSPLFAGCAAQPAHCLLDSWVRGSSSAGNWPGVAKSRIQTGNLLGQCSPLSRKGTPCLLRGIHRLRKRLSPFPERFDAFGANRGLHAVRRSQHLQQLVPVQLEGRRSQQQQPAGERCKIPAKGLAILSLGMTPVVCLVGDDERQIQLHVLEEHRDQFPVKVEKPVLEPIEIPFRMAFPVGDPLAVRQQAPRLGTSLRTRSPSSIKNSPPPA